MQELPTPQWEVDDYLKWMQRGFEYLIFQWKEQPEAERPPWQEVCRQEFLQVLETDENELESEPRLRVLSLFIYNADEGFTDETERWEMLLDESQQRVILQTCIDTWRQEGASTVPAAPPPLGTLASLTWLPTEQQDKLRTGLGETWIAKLRTFLDDNYPGWTGATQAGVATFVTSWMPKILSTAPPAPPPPAGGSPNQVARQALDDLNAKVSQGRKDLAAQASAEDLQQILAELLQEGMAARAR
jgi:hypothetical protein